MDAFAETSGAPALDATSVEQFAADVQYSISLNPRQLPSRYFYDDVGSALFEAICHLPWYGITRAESRLLAAHGVEIFRNVGPLSSIVELGPGTGEKLRVLLGSGPPRPTTVHLVDISRSALAASARTIGSLPNVQVAIHQAPYDAGLRQATTRADGRTLVAFLGSNVGNFDPPGAAAFLHTARLSLREGDLFLLGVDLVKAERTLVLAYDDPLGITAAFNRNLLVRINRELGGDFDLDQFSHRAVWSADHSRIEMHLVARSPQQVRIEKAHARFRVERDEMIWTESSYKYRPEDIASLLESAGYQIAGQWIDRQDLFALTLAEAR